MDYLNSDKRMYTLEASEQFDSLHVERWTGRETLSELYEWTIIALSPEANLPREPMLGERVTLLTRLADGTYCRRSGLVNEVINLGSDGDLTRYCLRLVPWLWVLTQSIHSRVFQEVSVRQIIQQVFEQYPLYAAWDYGAALSYLLREPVRKRSYCVQYRETDFNFIRRLLAEEGLGFHFVENPEAPAGHEMIIFCFSPGLDEDPTSIELEGFDYKPRGGCGTDEQDSVQFMGDVHRLNSTNRTLLSGNYKKRGSVATKSSTGEPGMGRESYDAVGEYAFATYNEASYYLTLHNDAAWVEHHFWKGTGCVRTARAGTRFSVYDAPWAQSEHLHGLKDFLFVEVRSFGINNLKAEVPDRFKQVEKLLRLEELEPRVQARANASGYAQQFRAVPRDKRWRPTLEDGTGQLLNPTPTAFGPQTAIVVGADGETTPGENGPLHCDKEGRIRVRFHWQEASESGSCWLRVAQRLAGPGHGAQFLPRIGQEVMVEFMDGDIDRPFIVGALYNGQGQGGRPPSPGGKLGASNGNPDLELFKKASDQHPSATHNFTSGHSPAWHGGAPGENLHRNAAALSGIKTQGFDGNGHNQLVFDDTDQQGRIQFASSHANSQLNMGHLIHQQDNYRGSFRGLGFELRTDAYGAIRGASGLLFSTYGIEPQTPAGDASAAKALLQQQIALAERFDLAAQIHETVGIASHRGIGHSRKSSLIAEQAPLNAQLTSLDTHVNGADLSQAKTDAAARNQSPGEGRVPHSGDPLLTFSAKDSSAMLAGQSLQFTAGETLTLGSGKDSNFAVGEQLRMHAGQAIGYLAGADKAEGVGISLVAGEGDLEVQAQHGDLNVHAKGDVQMVAVNLEAELAAGKTIHLAVEGGASLTIEDGNITFACPGEMKVLAGKKSYVGADRMAYGMPLFPESICLECMLSAAIRAKNTAELQ
jgi:type VI secretion system secreted protein VgrG